MGRQKRAFPLGHLRLRAPKNYVKDKTYQVEIEYVFSGKPIRRQTNIMVRVAEWNQEGNNGRGEIRASVPDSARLNNILNSRLNKIDGALHDYNQQHPGEVTADIIGALLDDKPVNRKDKGEDFVDFVQKRLDSELQRNKIQYSRYENGKSCMRKFRKFLKDKKLGTYAADSIYIGDITVEILDQYIAWRRDELNNKDTTINHALTPILKACNFASSMGFLDREINMQIQEMRIQEKASLEADGEKKFDGKYMTKDDFRKMVEFYNQDDRPRRKEYIEMFLFAYHACGLRIVDVASLQWGHIDFEKKELKKVLVKTNKRHTIPLTEPALRILYKWQAMGRRKKYVFDLFKDELNLDDAEALYGARNSATKSVNQALHVVGANIGLPFQLSFHTSRHSFAVHAVNDGMSMTILSRLLGHASTDVTEGVYAILLHETLAADVERLNYNFLPEDLS